MEKDILKEIDEFVESWRDHFYHEADGFEEDADDMLKDWGRLKEELNLDASSEKEVGRKKR